VSNSLPRLFFDCSTSRSARARCRLMPTYCALRCRASATRPRAKFFQNSKFALTLARLKRFLNRLSSCLGRTLRRSAGDANISVLNRRKDLILSAVIAFSDKLAERLADSTRSRPQVQSDMTDEADHMSLDELVSYCDERLPHQ